MGRRVISTIAFVLCFAAACGDGGVAPSSSRSTDSAFPLVPDADSLDPIGNRLGVAMQLTWGTGSREAAARAAELMRLRATGLRRIRIDFSWHRLETTRGVWDFSGLDAVVNDATQAGVAILGLLAYGNPLYAPNGRLGFESTPRDDLASWIYAAVSDPAPFARYVAAVVARYKDRVTDFEIWNEPNVGWRFWRPTADAASYVALVRAAATSARAACASCRFSLGGVAMAQPVPSFDLFPTGPAFLADVFARLPESAGIVDAVALHPYQFPKDPPEAETAPFPSRVQGSLATQLRSVAQLSGSARRGLALWVTENGWPTNMSVPTTDEEIARLLGVSVLVVAGARHLLGDARFSRLVDAFRGVSENDQASFTIRAALIAMAQGATRYDIYTLDDWATGADKNQEAAFGLFRANGDQKPVVAALRHLTSRYRAYRFVDDMSALLGLDTDDRREWALAFRDGARVAIAMWRWKDGRRTIRLPAVPGATEIVNAVGAILERGPAGTSFDVTLGPEVVWLEIDETRS
ncbi:MAG: beta-galactosidase [Deltaproteobacteria bacterium]|nr:beta-galactosidase [Deltaproteobacteria bacterium]